MYTVCRTGSLNNDGRQLSPYMARKPSMISAMVGSYVFTTKSSTLGGYPVLSDERSVGKTAPLRRHHMLMDALLYCMRKCVRCQLPGSGALEPQEIVVIALHEIHATIDLLDII